MKPYHIEIDNITKRDWDKLLQGFYDASLFQSWAYGESFFGGRQLAHMVLKRDHQVVALAQGRVIKLPFLPVGAANFLYAPLWHRDNAPPDPEVLRRMVRAIREEYALRRGLLVSVRSHDNSAFDSDSIVGNIFENEGFVRQPQAFYRTIKLDLNPSLETLRANLKQKWRRNLSRAERRGLSVRTGNDDTLFSAYQQLHAEMLRRQHPEKWYNPDLDKYWMLLKELSVDKGRIILIAEYQGQPVAGIVIAAMGDTGMDLFSATGETSIREKLNALYFLQWQAVVWLKANGYRWYDLRGYDPERFPGVSCFKEGLSGEDIRYAEFRACSNPLSRIFVTRGTDVVNRYHLRNLMMRK